MSIFETIKKRRSIGKMTDQRPSRQQIERLLEAATHAPNHHNAQPWHFVVLAGQARAEIGGIMADSLVTRLEDPKGPTGQALIAKERNKLMRAPVVIAVISEHAQQPNVLDIENIEATAAAVENMLLVADELELAAMWRTGEPAHDPTVKSRLGFSEQDEIVAFLYVGYPTIQAPIREPIPFSEKTRWLGWEE